ncbi:MAG: transposase [Planctomycetes bacterium]|nr:transposase [Planctomycetota bacterium]MBU4397923.1 transposase [Planctomycetota bacterium]MCG2683060.1 transposase [Planctomycetales bacterium]
MSEYQRWFVPGGTYFFTVATHRRQPILATDPGRQCLRAAFQYVRVNRPFSIVAVVLLPDHIHAVWTLPPKDNDYSTRWRRIKGRFTREFLAGGGNDGDSTDSRASRGERAIWQRRFWEHTCRDEDDLKRCVDYIHWNPVKHGQVRRVRDYPWSSFRRFVLLGEYSIDWGGENPCPDWNQPE